MPAPRTDGVGGGYQVEPVATDGLDFRLLTITRIYPAVMLEDPAGMRDAAVAWQNLGGLLDAEARSLRRSLAGLGDDWRSEAAARFAERGAATVGSLERWSEIAAARATELADLAVVVAGAKLRMQWIWDDFSRAAGEIAARSEASDRVTEGPAGSALIALVTSALAGNDLEDNVRRYTRQALDEVVEPLATRFAESALAFAAPGPVFAGPTDAVVPGDATVAALVTGAWLPDGVALPCGPALPRIPATPAALGAGAVPGLSAVPALPPAPALALPAAPSSPAAPALPAASAMPPLATVPAAPVLLGRTVRPAVPGMPTGSATPRAMVPAVLRPVPTPPNPGPRPLPRVPATPMATLGTVDRGATPSLAGRGALAVDHVPTVPGSTTRSLVGAPALRDHLSGRALPVAPGQPGPPGFPPGAGSPPSSRLAGSSPTTPSGPTRPRGEVPPMLGGRASGPPSRRHPGPSSADVQLLGRAAQPPGPPAAPTPAPGSPRHANPMGAGPADGCLVIRPAAPSASHRRLDPAADALRATGHPAPALPEPALRPNRPAPSTPLGPALRPPTRALSAAPVPAQQPGSPTRAADLPAAEAERPAPRATPQAGRPRPTPAPAASTGQRGRHAAPDPAPSPAEARAADRARRRAAWEEARREHGAGEPVSA